MGKKEHNVRSEATLRKAVKLLSERAAYLLFPSMIPVEVHVFRNKTTEIFAIFDLRDCYRKRAPLTGVTKRVRAALRPRRKR